MHLQPTRLLAPLKTSAWLSNGHLTLNVANAEVLHHPNTALSSRASWSGASAPRVTLSHSQRPTRSCPPCEAHESCHPHDTTSKLGSLVLLFSATRLPPSLPLLRTTPHSPEASLVPLLPVSIALSSSAYTLSFFHQSHCAMATESLYWDFSPLSSLPRPSAFLKQAG